MKEVIASAILRKDDYYNEGYLIFDGTGTEAKGIFALDYAKIFFKGSNLRFLLYEFSVDNFMLYQREYNFLQSVSYISFTESYTLYSEEGTLELCIGSLVTDKRKKNF